MSDKITTLRGTLPGCLTCETYGMIQDMADEDAAIERAYGCGFCAHKYWWVYKSPEVIAEIKADWYPEPEQPQQGDLFAP